MSLPVTLGLASIFAVIILGTTVLSLVAPVVWKHGVLFGVTVALDTLQQPEGRALFNRWRIVMGSVGVGLAAASVITALALPPGLYAALVGPALLVAFLAVNLVLYIVFHHQAAAFALPAGNAVRVASLDARHLARAPLWWEILPLALIAVTAIFLTLRYVAAPASIPIHWNIAGQPDRYVPKTVLSYYNLVWTQIGLWLLLTLIALGVRTMRISARGGNVTGFYVTLARILFWAKTLVILLLGVLAMLTVATPTLRLKAAIPIVVVVFMVALFATIGVSLRAYGSQLNVAKTDIVGDGTPDRYWIGGMIYRNPTDPALFVPRRIGIGVTLNFGHPASWLVLIAILGVLVATVLVAVVASSR